MLPAILALLARIAGAQELPKQPLQELFFTEVVYPQEKHEVQLTLGGLVDRSRPDLPTLTPLAIEYGLTDRWQIEGGWDGYTQFQSSPSRHLRTARVSVGTKYSFMHIGGSPIHAAFGVDVELPRAETFADDEGEAGLEIEPVVALAADLGHHVTVFGSAGASLEPRRVASIVQRGERPDDVGTISVGALVAFRRATVAAEYTNRNDALPWRLDGDPLLTPSLVLHPPHGWELAAGIPIDARDLHQRPGFALHIVKEF